MSNQDTKQFDLEALAEEVVTRPAPESCQEIAGLLQSLPLWSSFINTSPKPEQKRALELLMEESVLPTAEKILFMAEIACGKYHRIRRDGDFRGFRPEKAKALYTQYYQLTGSEEVKYILEHFDSFEKHCRDSYFDRQSDDDFAPYANSKPSTSRDPDSEEWRR